MYYYMGDSAGSSEGYVFIYDDTDRSVQFIQKSLVDNAGVTITGILQFDDGVNFGKLMFLGFNKVDNSERLWISRNICEYRIGDIDVSLSIVVENLCGYYGYIALALKDKFGNYLDDESYSIKHNLGSYVYTQYVSVTGMAPCIAIPYKMVLYILNLHSKHDFDGLMQAFSNLIGTDLSTFIHGVDSALNTIEFGRWCL